MRTLGQFCAEGREPATSKWAAGKTSQRHWDHDPKATLPWSPGPPCSRTPAPSPQVNHLTAPPTRPQQCRGGLAAATRPSNTRGQSTGRHRASSCAVSLHCSECANRILLTLPHWGLFCLFKDSTSFSVCQFTKHTPCEGCDWTALMSLIPRINLGESWHRHSTGSSNREPLLTHVFCHLLFYSFPTVLKLF